MKNSIIYKSIAALFLMLLFSVGVQAQNKTHTIKKGETLFSIAKQYDVSVSQLRQLNDISGNALNVGQQIAITKENNTGSEGKTTTHIVQKGETLFGIAKSNNVRIAEIKSWNDLSANNLSVGQKLTLYPKENSGNEDKPDTSSNKITSNDEADQNTYYTVKNGDTLYGIAQQHQMTVKEVKNLNSLSSSNISVGQQLTVSDTDRDAPPSIAAEVGSAPQGKFINYTLKSGDTKLGALLRKFNMDKTEFGELNPSVNTSSLRRGQSVTVLAPPTKIRKNPFLDQLSLQNLGSASASKYKDGAKATPTTSGELYNPKALTAAHSNMALGSVVFVKNPANSKGIFIRINDRSSSNGLKLSAAAWSALSMTSSSPQISIYKR